jgi:hypothetical protein
MMRIVAATIVVVMLTSTAAAQVVTLTCDGTRKSVLLGSDDTPEKISNEGAVVNLDEGTVTLLGFTSQITKSGAVFVEFRGRGPTSTWRVGAFWAG